jgi:DNA-directed RNA polymerase specialized sigma24 family protein
MRSSVSAEELAKIAGVKVTTVRKTAHELLELLKRDLESHGVSVKEVDSR